MKQDNQLKDKLEDELEDVIDALESSDKDSANSTSNNSDCEADKIKSFFSFASGRTIVIGLVIFLLGLSFSIVYFKQTYFGITGKTVMTSINDFSSGVPATPSLIAFGQRNTQSLSPQPFAPQQAQATIALSQQEYKDLTYMREEEKLARDVYTFLYNQWKLSLFASIAKSEQRHTDRMLMLLQSYNIADPSLNADYGVFKNPHLSGLYKSLIAKGKISVLEALKVGALIEEVDIKDLNTAISQTNKSNILTSYKNIRNGSYHHLRAFVHSIELYGQNYKASVLTQANVDQIVNAPITSVMPFVLGQ